MCYNIPEVNPMDEKNAYTPRPGWQVWLARLGVVGMILFVIWQLIQVAGGGL